MAIAKLTSVTLVSGSGSPATKLQASAHGPVKFDVVTFVGPNKVGGNLGYTGTVGNAGLKAGIGAIRKNTPTVLAVLPVGIGSYTFSYDPDTDMLRIFATGASPAEISDATDMAAVTLQALVISV
jgi:hypothetical protein